MFSIFSAIIQLFFICLPTYKANIKIISIYLDTYKAIENIYDT